MDITHQFSHVVVSTDSGPQRPKSEKPQSAKRSHPRVFENGKVIPYKAKYYVNDTTTYSCHSDYTFRGSAVRVCKPNGKWSGSTPICGLDSDHCPDPGVPPGSSRTGNIFNKDNKVTYHCESPLTLIGSKVRVCLDGGQWSGTEPQCYADFTYDTPEEASEAFSGSLKSNLAISQQYEKEEQRGKKITLDQGGKLDIYIAVDASDSIDEKDFHNAKTTIKLLIDKISYYPVSPNYEILIFATDVTPIIKMKHFKMRKPSLLDIFKDMDDFTYESRGEKTGTNIAKAYSSIHESMQIEELNNATAFSETQHIIILFTDGQANMGGNPKRKVDQIKRFVTEKDPKRERNLDLYVFGVGDDVNQEYINGLVSQRDQEKYFFKLQDLTKIQEMFDDMIDESTSVGLCGIVWEGLENKRRAAFPWLAQINVAHPPKSSNCMGSLVSSSYILTAAHCFKEGDTPDKIIVKLEKGLVVKVKKYVIHPDFDLTAKQELGIQEYYEFNVALIQLEKPVDLSSNLRPICIPCTKETNAALKLSETEGTCRRHVFGAVLQGSLFGLVGKLPPRFNSLFMSGQAVAGIFSGIAMLLSNIFETDSESSALGYFITPCVATLLTLCCYLVLPHLRFAQLHLENVSTKTTMKEPSANSCEIVKVKLNHFDNGFDDTEGETCKKLNELKQEPTEEKSTVPQVFKKIWVMALCVTCVFAVTLCVFPAITINTKPSGLFDGKDNIFVPLCSFIVFNVMDWIGRSLTSRLQWPSMKSRLFPFFVVLRVVFIPALMLCNIQPRFYLPVFFKHDMAYIIIMSLFAMTNGYFACLSMSYAPQLVRSKDAETAGALMTFFLALGLSLGGAFSFGLKIIV
ncbi:hypothetical protein G5714_020500 [Onychostoma macrolepis]|uniref:C3/C5 convertase n=1 Tax=Onychostoma macrolepis TaxID=369639 RepID=A0A7J6BTZ3_9TELE|nr:hypothetical protein G5714_020500 [Onychostoma macrolepis]